jgi:hypothetical protein
MRYVRLTLLGTLIVSVLLIDVATQLTRPVFDVASVRPNRSGSPAAGGPSATIAVRPGGAFDATNATLESPYAPSATRHSNVRERAQSVSPPWPLRAPRHSCSMATVSSARPSVSQRPKSGAVAVTNVSTLSISGACSGSKARPARRRVSAGERPRRARAGGRAADTARCRIIYTTDKTGAPDTDRATGRLGS